MHPHRSKTRLPGFSSSPLTTLGSALGAALRTPGGVAQGCPAASPSARQQRQHPPGSDPQPRSGATASATLPRGTAAKRGRSRGEEGHGAGLAHGRAPCVGGERAHRAQDPALFELLGGGFGLRVLRHLAEKEKPTHPNATASRQRLPGKRH